VQPTSAEARADIAAAHARVMHTLYVGAHSTAVALREYATELRDRLRVDARRRPPVESRPDVREIKAAEAMLSRFEVFEQLAGDTWRQIQSLPAFLAKFGPPLHRHGCSRR
jgi:hypothetical protein